MGEARRKKQLGISDNGIALARHIVKSWVKDRPTALSLIPKLLSHALANKIYITVCHAVGQQNVAAFCKTVMTMGGRVVQSSVDAEGNEIVAQADVILIPIFGQITHIDQMIEEQTFLSKISALLTSSGIVHKDSDILLYNKDLLSHKVAFTLPRELHRIAEAGIQDWMNADLHSATLKNLMHELNLDAPRANDASVQNAATMRFLVGVRVIRSAKGDESQKFDLISNNLDQSEIIDQEEEEVITNFIKEINKITEQDKIRVNFGFPEEWFSAIETAALVSVNAQFTLQGQQTNSPLHLESHAHVATDVHGNVYIGMQDPDGTWHGPAILSREFSAHTDKVREWINYNRPAPVFYKSVQDLKDVMAAAKETIAD
jgi:hypothetical protein